MIKFLIDECVTPELVGVARRNGYFESNHVTWIGLKGYPDYALMPEILNNDWTFVTNNSKHFRPQKGKTKALYTDVSIHAGLICLDYPNWVVADGQIEYFQAVLDVIKDQKVDLINKLVIVKPNLKILDKISVTIEDLP